MEVFGGFFMWQAEELARRYRLVFDGQIILEMGQVAWPYIGLPKRLGMEV